MSFLHYDIQKNERNKKFVITRVEDYGCSFVVAEVEADDVLSFDTALLTQEGKWYTLYFFDKAVPTFIGKKISEYRAFQGGEHWILALKVCNSWKFIIPKKSHFYSKEPVTWSNAALLEISITDDSLPAYFKEGFDHTHYYVFHANGKDYLIDPGKFTAPLTITSTITEFTELTPLSQKGYFKATNEEGEFLSEGLELFGQYAKVEEFAGEDYSEHFKELHVYQGKDADGNILMLDIPKKYVFFFKKPAKSVYFYGRTYQENYAYENDTYYDVWQVIYADGQKSLKTWASPPCHFIDIDENAWNF